MKGLLKRIVDNINAPTTLIVRTDAHSGHKLGLQNPETELWEENEEGDLEPYSPELTATQRWLWESYTKHVNEAMRLAGDDEIVLLDLGDVCQGSKYPAPLVSVRDADQVELALGTFKPFEEHKDRIRAIRLVVGTSAHNFSFGSAEVSLLGRLKNTFHKSSVKLVKHGLFTVAGVAVDAAHHGPSGGSRAWLQGNIMRRYLQSLMMDEIMAGQSPSSLVLRAHHHVAPPPETVRLSDKSGRMWSSTMHLVPSYCGVSQYARQATRSISSLTIGLLSFRLRSGAVENWRRFTETIDIRTKEVL